MYFLNFLADIGKYFIRNPSSLVAPPGDRVTFECETNIPAEQVSLCFSYEFYGFQIIILILVNNSKSILWILTAHIKYTFISILYFNAASLNPL